jgi:hypothetical protein
MRALFSLLLVVLLGMPATVQQDLKPFVFDHRGSVNSVIDLSFLLDAPGGKRGFARVSDGHLVTGDGALAAVGRERDGLDTRLDHVSAKGGCSDVGLDSARFGINCVRLHFLDLASPRGLIDSQREDTRAFDPEQLDRFDNWTAELKKQGIYLNINLNVGRSYKAADGVKDADKIRWGKGTDTL